MRKCCVPGCHSNYGKPYVPTFLFPRDDYRRKLWEQSIGRPGIKVTNNIGVCVKHFTETDIIRYDTIETDDGVVSSVRKKVKLKNEACPTLHVPPGGFGNEEPTRNVNKDMNNVEMEDDDDDDDDIKIIGVANKTRLHNADALGIHSPPNASLRTKNDERGMSSRGKVTSKKRSSSVGSNSSNGSSEAAKSAPSTPKRRRTERQPPTVIGRSNDGYCWVCHKEAITLTCLACPRAFHLRCALEKEYISDWVCQECCKITEAENVDTRSKCLSEISLEKFCMLLKCCLSKLKCRAPAAFHQPVPIEYYSSYLDYVIHPVDLSLIEKNIKNKKYGCTESFLADVKWVQHNSCVFNGSQHPLTVNAKSLVKTCEADMAEIEVCPDCFLHACTRNKYWFSDLCRKPHPLVWAKLKGFPYWPAKVVRIHDLNVDARFFGAHDRAWVPISQCYHLSKEMPTSSKPKKKGTYETALEELNVHVTYLKQKYGVFEYAPYRTLFDPDSKIYAYHGIDINKISVKEDVSCNAGTATNTNAITSKAISPFTLPTASSEPGSNAKIPEQKPCVSKMSPANGVRCLSFENPSPSPSNSNDCEMKNVEKKPVPCGVFEISKNVSFEPASTLKTKDTVDIKPVINTDSANSRKIESALERLKEVFSEDANMKEDNSNSSVKVESKTEASVCVKKETETPDKEIPIPEALKGFSATSVVKKEISAPFEMGNINSASTNESYTQSPLKNVVATSSTIKTEHTNSSPICLDNQNSSQVQKNAAFSQWLKESPKSSDGNITGPVLTDVCSLSPSNAQVKTENSFSFKVTENPTSQIRKENPIFSPVQCANLSSSPVKVETLLSSQVQKGELISSQGQNENCSSIVHSEISTASPGQSKVSFFKECEKTLEDCNSESATSTDKIEEKEKQISLSSGPTKLDSFALKLCKTIESCKAKLGITQFDDDENSSSSESCEDEEDEEEDEDEEQEEEGDIDNDNENIDKKENESSSDSGDESDSSSSDEDDECSLEGESKLAENSSTNNKMISPPAIIGEPSGNPTEAVEVCKQELATQKDFIAGTKYQNEANCSNESEGIQNQCLQQKMPSSDVEIQLLDTHSEMESYDDMLRTETVSSEIQLSDVTQGSDSSEKDKETLHTLDGYSDSETGIIKKQNSGIFCGKQIEDGSVIGCRNDSLVFSNRFSETRSEQLAFGVGDRCVVPENCGEIDKTVEAKTDSPMGQDESEESMDFAENNESVDLDEVGRNLVIVDGDRNMELDQNNKSSELNAMQVELECSASVDHKYSNNADMNYNKVIKIAECDKRVAFHGKGRNIDLKLKCINEDIEMDEDDKKLENIAKSICKENVEENDQSPGFGKIVNSYTIVEKSGVKMESSESGCSYAMKNENDEYFNVEEEEEILEALNDCSMEFDIEKPCVELPKEEPKTVNKLQDVNKLATTKVIDVIELSSSDSESDEDNDDEASSKSSKSDHKSEEPHNKMLINISSDSQSSESSKESSSCASKHSPDSTGADSLGKNVISAEVTGINLDVKPDMQETPLEASIGVMQKTEHEYSNAAVISFDELSIQRNAVHISETDGDSTPKSSVEINNLIGISTCVTKCEKDDLMNSINITNVFSVPVEQNMLPAKTVEKEEITPEDSKFSVVTDELKEVDRPEPKNSPHCDNVEPRELIQDLEQQIKLYKQKCETIEWFHSQEKIELRHNMNLILMEMRASLEADKKAAVDSLKRQHEDEKARIIAEAKGKQWCASCKQPAIFHCCWNTSYCSHSCQKHHWPQHRFYCAQIKSAPPVKTAVTEFVKIAKKPTTSEESSNAEKKLIFVNVKSNEVVQQAVISQSMPSSSSPSSSVVAVSTSHAQIPLNAPKVQILSKTPVHLMSSTSLSNISQASGPLSMLPNAPVQLVLAPMKTTDNKSPSLSPLHSKVVRDSSEIITKVRSRQTDLNTAIHLLNMMNKETEETLKKKSDDSSEEIVFSLPKSEGEISDSIEANSTIPSKSTNESKLTDAVPHDEEMMVDDEDNDDDNEMVPLAAGIEISAKKLRYCLKAGLTPTKLTRCLIDAFFPNAETLANSCVFGRRSNVTKQTRPALPLNTVNAILDFVSGKFPSAQKTDLVLAMNLKCKEARRYMFKNSQEVTLSEVAKDTELKEPAEKKFSLAPSFEETSQPSSEKITTSPKGLITTVSSTSSGATTGTVSNVLPHLSRAMTTTIRTVIPAKNVHLVSAHKSLSGSSSGKRIVTLPRIFTTTSTMAKHQIAIKPKPIFVTAGKSAGNLVQIPTNIVQVVSALPISQNIPEIQSTKAAGVSSEQKVVKAEKADNKLNLLSGVGQCKQTTVINQPVMSTQDTAGSEESRRPFVILGRSAMQKEFLLRPVTQSGPSPSTTTASQILEKLDCF